MSKYFTVALTIMLVNCSSSEPNSTNNGPDTGIAPTDTATALDTGSEASSDAVTTDDAVATPEAAAAEVGGKPAKPSIVSVVKMAGVLHVTWKANDTGLSNIELWRKKDSGDFAKIFTLPGIATSQHDTGATPPGTYCYKVTTIRGGLASDSSEESCGTP